MNLAQFNKLQGVVKQTAEALINIKLENKNLKEEIENLKNQIVKSETRIPKKVSEDLRRLTRENELLQKRQNIASDRLSNMLNKVKDDAGGVGS